MMFRLRHHIIDPDPNLLFLTRWLQKSSRVSKWHDERDSMRRMAFIIVVHFIWFERSCHQCLQW